jgi:hypothetical protein
MVWDLQKARLPRALTVFACWSLESLPISDTSNQRQQRRPFTPLDLL